MAARCTDSLNRGHGSHHPQRVADCEFALESWRPVIQRESLIDGVTVSTIIIIVVAFEAALWLTQAKEVDRDHALRGGPLLLQRDCANR